MIHEKGYWIGEDVKQHHYFDPGLAGALISFLTKEKQNKSVDLGCGIGNYVQHLRNRDLCTDGYDGNPDTPMLTNKVCGVLDLSTSKKLSIEYDWVISLEVGEHIPKEYEDVFIDNLHINNKKGIILSWAIEGQPGIGHVNCRNNSYIVNKLKELSYEYDIPATNQMRQAAILPWFKETVMVFRRIA
jgi:hypothetical protein